MSRKYKSQILSQNFVYPNNQVAEYDLEIEHEINNNSVSGVVTTFSATTISSTGITFNILATWSRNGAEEFIKPDNTRSLASVHMMANTQLYYKPWRLVKDYVDGGGSNTSVISNTFTVLPSQLGISGFTTGTYYFEVRFIGLKSIYPVCVTLPITVPASPTPTPTPTNTPTSTPTPTPTSTPTNTPTSTPTPTPTSTPTSTPTATPAPVGQCYCFPIVVTGTTIPGPEGGTIATLQYNDCFGVLTARAFSVGPGTYYQCIQVISSVVQYDPVGTTGIDQSYLTLTYLTGNCNTGYVCTGFDPAVTPTPTPTSTSTPTPTPTAGGPTPTPTPTSTPTSTPTPTPTAGGLTAFSGCGYGSSVAAACNDAGINARTLFSNCDAGSFGVGCVVYVDAGGNTILTGYTNIFMNSACWDINSSTGVVTAFSSVQC